MINFDDPFGRQLYGQLEGLCDRVRYSLHEAQTELWLKEFTPEASGFRALVDGQWGEFELQVPLLGSFNASNVLAALPPCSPWVCRLSVHRSQFPPHAASGRLERVTGADDKHVVVDYAHTPDALANALAALRPHAAGKLICVFGCGGDRDAGKRPEMAAEAEKRADVVIVMTTTRALKIRRRLLPILCRAFLQVSRTGLSMTAQRPSPKPLPWPVRTTWCWWSERATRPTSAGQKLPFSDAEQVRHHLNLNGGVA